MARGKGEGEATLFTIEKRGIYNLQYVIYKGVERGWWKKGERVENFPAGALVHHREGPVPIKICANKKIGKKKKGTEGHPEKYGTFSRRRKIGGRGQGADDKVLPALPENLGARAGLGKFIFISNQPFTGKILIGHVIHQSHTNFLLLHV